MSKHERSVLKKHDDIFKLIALYQGQRCLWDHTLEESKDAKLRRKAFNEIASKIDVTSEDVRKKLHNLRSQFRRENMRMRNSRSEEPRWIYYNALKFLYANKHKYNIKLEDIDPLEEQKSSSSIQGQRFDDADSDAEYEQDDFIEPDDVETEIYEQKHFPLNSNLRAGNELRSENSILRDERLKTMYNYRDKMKKVIVIPHQLEQRDEYTVFGENVANELRSLANNKSLQQTLKCTISEAILKINKLAHNSATQHNLSDAYDECLEEY